ncbi:MAG: hypothetical protein FJ197_02195 [Gammaproteobacteria bacterium]|nr:hypothetical protein [Gammaproteobacteria bacterium]
MTRHRRNGGFGLVEVMVSVLIGSLLLIGVLSIFAETRSTYRTTDAVSRMQENTRFAMATIEPDIRLAGSWGLHNIAAQVSVPAAVVVTCDDATDVSAEVLDVLNPVAAANDGYVDLVPCDPFEDNYLAGTDTLVVRHASGAPVGAVAGTVQIQSDRYQSVVFDDGAEPGTVDCPVPAAPPASPQIRCTYNWITNYYYVASSSSLGATVPSLRRQVLQNGVVTDQELITGVEDLQVQLGIDTDGDGTVERYLEADHPDFVAGTPVMAVRMWLMFRAERREVGFVDGATYNYADVADYAPADGFRRSLFNKTILLRNLRPG